MRFKLSLMKKIWLSLLVLAVVAVSVFSQTHKRQDKIKERIQGELHIDAAKADSTAKIVQRFMANSRKIRIDTVMKEEEKRTALQTERRHEVAILKTFLTEQQIKKLQSLLREYKTRKQENEEKADTSLKKYYF